MNSIRNAALVVFACLAILPRPSLADDSYSPYVGEEFPRNLYWGDTHVHSSWSVDAGISGNLKLDPDQAFRFARGEEIRAHNGMAVRLRRPLDFLLVSDHAEYLGVMPRLDAQDPLALSTETGRRWYQLRKENDTTELWREFAASMVPGIDMIESVPLQRSIWQEVIANAERHNAPGIFTAFIGYEWTSTAGGNNLHRNVLFADGSLETRQTLPYTSFESFDPEDLWRALAAYEEKTGGRVLAIPHNSNLSGGQMFGTETRSGGPLSKDYVRRRARWEPLVEVTQYKGDSETHPFLSPDDEFADYETWGKGNLAGRRNEPWMLQHSFVRSALKLGLTLQSRFGENPFKMGMIGSSDSHSGFAAAEENNFWGKFSRAEPRADRWSAAFFPPGTKPDVYHYEWQMAASGYAGIWAEENTREALFDAMLRKETYATTGPRMVVRFFGGWTFEAGDEFLPDMAAVGYAEGVPMGGDLSAPPENDRKAHPRFMAFVLRDPEGAYLDRVQIVKGWRDGRGEVHERVYDVAVSDGRKIGRNGKADQSVGSTVDVERATYSNRIGAAQLAVVWEDPDFDRDESAFYYLRAIEIPKPRWTAYDQLYFGIEMDEKIPMTTQDRAYTSPIWYTPRSLAEPSR